MDIDRAVAAVRANSHAVLTTLRQDGRPQLSNVLVDGESFWSYAVVEGDVTLSEVAADPHDAAADELVELYRSLSGEHDDWEDYRAAMVRDRRVVVRISPTHAYGALR